MNERGGDNKNGVELRVSMLIRKSLSFGMVATVFALGVASYAEEETEESPFAIVSAEGPPPSPHVMGWIDSRNVESLNGS